MTGALTAGRRAAESRMVDTCVIGRAIRSNQLDETTGEYPMTVVPVYTGRCKLTLGAVQVRDVDSQGQDLAVADAVLSIPVNAVGSNLIEKDHVATITLSAFDSGTVWAVIQAGHAQSFATARRFPIEITT